MPLRTVAGPRRLALGACFDFRDLGGYRTAHGGRTRWRRLFRSDGLHRLTSADEVDVGALGISTVLDLRTFEEVATQGPARVRATHHQLAMAEILPAANGVPGCTAEAAVVAEAYHSALASSAEVMCEVLAVLTDPSSLPAVVTCTSGVDRTGIVTAVLLALLGVPDEIVVGDHAASREAALRRMGRLRFEHPSAVRHDLDRYGPGVLGVVPEAMALFLGRLRAEHGSVAGYADSIDMAGAVPYLRAALVDG